MIVKFTSAHSPYRANEVASFSPAEGLRLVEVLKVAVPMELVKLKTAHEGHEAGKAIVVTPEEAAELVKAKVGSYEGGKADWPVPAPPAEPSSQPSSSSTPEGGDSKKDEAK